jgi:hypothetical protein
MRYNEIIGLHEYFQPNYDLTNEVGTYWKRFIPNEKFFSALIKTLNSIENDNPDESKSLWLQGTYGTGKSHATAVIKHLLYDAWDKINDYIEENLEDTQLKFRLKNFRENKKVFPVVLKGTSSIVDNRTFALVIEKAVKNKLKEEKIEISTKSDFEKLIYQIKENPANINWQKNIEESELKLYVKDKEELINKLEKGDITILTELEDISSKNGLHFSYSNISNWLDEVANELKKNGIADALMIYWDEFTSIWGISKIGVLLTELQNIAELSINKDVYLFVVTHRRPEQIETDIARDDMKKVLGRFKILDYSMEPITTYHIINASIKKKDKNRWEELKNKQIDDVKPLIQTIIGNEGVKVQRYIEDLFPIHPYTAYLSTFIARNIGSTERSIFTFLYDEEKGFRKFINSNPDTDGNIFLTADYLWDFFYEEFERTDNEKFSSALERFKLHKDTLEGKGDAYLAIFKGILLLNILFKVAELSESSLVAPTIDNIKSMFQGSKYEKYVDDVLSFVNTEQIITKTPDNLYLISSASLPFREIEKEKQNLLSQYKEINKILYLKHITEFEDIFSNSVNRDIEVKLFDAALNEYFLRNKLEKVFSRSYSIHLAVFIGKDNQELEQIRKTISNIKDDEEFKNVIFVIIETILDELTFNKFIEYKARAAVADKHSYTDDRNINEDYARKVLDEWITKANSGYLEWVLRNETDKSLINNFSEKINTELSQKIFQYGFENLDECQRNRNIWPKKNAKIIVETFLFANSREYIEERTEKRPERYLRGIIKDNNGEYVVDSNLKFKQNINETHPLKKMDIEIEKAINNHKDDGTFSLGEILNFLNKPPYGLYPNMVNMGAMGFLMREYVEKLYEAGMWKPIEKEIMRDKILSLFKYWENNKDYLGKLEVRFGTEEEKELVGLLTDLFDLKDVGNLTNVRWKIREWVKASSYPLWIFKLSKKSNDLTNKAIDNMFQLIQSIDKEITYADIKSYLNTIGDVHYDLGLIIKKEEAESLFKKWLMEIENVEIPETEIQQVIDYLRKSMQEEVASWREDRVREKVKDWWIEKERKKKEKEDEEKENEKGGVSPPDNGGAITLKRVEEMKSRIEKYEGSKAKKILIRLIEDNPEIVNYIEKYEEA